jgi:hypothetical protein
MYKQLRPGQKNNDPYLSLSDRMGLLIFVSFDQHASGQ